MMQGRDDGGAISTLGRVVNDEVIGGVDQGFLKTMGAEAGSASRIQASLNQQIHQTLRWNLASGVYLPGQRLSTRTLAKEFGTSAMPVRDALKQLVAQRVLAVEPNSAFRVPVVDRTRGVQLFEIRNALESLAIRHAVPHLTSVHVDLLRKVNNDAIAAMERRDPQGYFAANYSFHFIIYSASGSQDLVAMIEELWMQIGPFFASILDVNKYNHAWQSHHHDAVAAIQARDVEAAVNAIANDINSAKDYFVAAEELSTSHRRPLSDKRIDAVQSLREIGREQSGAPRSASRSLARRA